MATIDPMFLLQYGAIGLVLAWFMFRFEKKLESLTVAIQSLERVIDAKS